ncbi:heme A synthase [Microbacterium sp. RU33B]|uniref:COX15/CtaA family protein n=1 Tax=Microbacterium sp. RU33B TaxID=1907390 RepID=UPI0009605A85|nr:COX15/CtaA family protein [Microbacterium sp. RU33B]SIT76276.1 cytochrome c oxidase assembly protein subunit 15 [Microbacterium sp. RU33B]
MSAPTTQNRVLSFLLPTTVTRWVRVMAWLSLVVNIGIVGTGGLVRLTGSGMGCETWPYCTADSLVPTPELGIHGLIEFGNRTLTGVLIIVAALTFLSVVRLRPRRRELRVISFAIGLGIILQAVIGGITVWLHLHPTIVGVHYFISAVLVALAAVLVCRVYATPGPRVRAVAPGYALLVHLTSVAVLVTVVVGILLTGSGPHAGDDAAARNGLDPILWQHIHSWPGYVTLGLTVLLLIGAFRTPPALRLRLWVGLLFAIEVVQIVIGLWQARTGLPIVLVNIHMVLAVCLVAAMTAVVMNLTTTVSASAPVEEMRLEESRASS